MRSNLALKFTTTAKRNAYREPYPPILFCVGQEKQHEAPEEASGLKCPLGNLCNDPGIIRAMSRIMKE